MSQLKLFNTGLIGKKVMISEATAYCIEEKEDLYMFWAKGVCTAEKDGKYTVTIPPNFIDMRRIGSHHGRNTDGWIGERSYICEKVDEF